MTIQINKNQLHHIYRCTYLKILFEVMTNERSKRVLDRLHYWILNKQLVVYKIRNCASFSCVSGGCESLNISEMLTCHWQQDKLHCLSCLVIKMNDSCYDCLTRFTSRLSTNNTDNFDREETFSVLDEFSCARDKVCIFY